MSPLARNAVLVAAATAAGALEARAVDLRGMFGAWGLERWRTAIGNVGFVWRSPGGREFRCAAQVAETAALKGAVAWWLARSAAIEQEEARALENDRLIEV